MRWSIEVANLRGDEGLVIEILEQAGYRLETLNGEDNSLRVLHHAKYDAYESASQVRGDSKSLGEKLSRFSELDGEVLGIQFALVRLHNSDGSTSRFNFAQASSVLGPLSTIVTIAVIPDSAISAEDRQKTAAEHAAQERKKRRIAKVRLAAAALQSARVFEVLELMKLSEPTATELGHIVDLILDASGGNLNWYTSDKQLRRFNHSTNDPSVFGLGARHAVAKSNPPAKPMTRAEARGFARGLGTAWLKKFEDGVERV